MAIYMLNLVVVLVCGYMAEVTKKYDEEKKKYKYNLILLLIPICTLILISGFRYKVGTDFNTYAEYIIYFDHTPVSLTEEAGFSVILNIIRSITNNPQLFFMVTSIFINIGVVIFLQRYSTNIFLSLYFYITTFMYYGTMNGIRQYIANIIFLLGYKYILNGSFKKYFVYVFLAFLFHNSALIMIPVYFLVRKRSDSVWNIGILFAMIMAMLFYDTFLEMLFTLLKGTKFEYYESYFIGVSDGANILRIIVWMAPVVLIFLYKDRARLVFGDKVDIIINLCYLGAIFMLLALKHTFFARMCMYFDGYYLLLLPQLCQMFDKKTNKVMTIVIMSGYFAYSTLLLLAGESNIYPYGYNFKLF